MFLSPVTPGHNQHRCEFDAPWCRLLKAISLLGTAVLLGTFVTVWISMPTGSFWTRLFALSAAPLIFTGCALFTVRRYRLEGRALLVQRLFWWTRVSLEGLRDAAADPQALRGSVRLCGNGGLFSFSGWYYRKGLGRFRAWVTDPGRAVGTQVQQSEHCAQPF